MKSQLQDAPKVGAGQSDRILKDPVDSKQLNIDALMEFLFSTRELRDNVNISHKKGQIVALIDMFGCLTDGKSLDETKKIIDSPEYKA